MEEAPGGSGRGLEALGAGARPVSLTEVNAGRGRVFDYKPLKCMIMPFHSFLEALTETSF